MFASAFSSLDFGAALKRYYELFEERKDRKATEAVDGHEFEVTEFEPETEADVIEMLNLARRAGAIR